MGWTVGLRYHNHEAGICRVLRSKLVYRGLVFDCLSCLYSIILMMGEGGDSHTVLKAESSDARCPKLSRAMSYRRNSIWN